MRRAQARPLSCSTGSLGRFHVAPSDPALLAAGCRVIAPDLRGYGLSDAPEAVENYDIAQLTADIAGLLDALGVQKAIFMGHDWGGLLAWQMPLFYEQRVSGVISLNTPHIPHWMLWLHRDLVSAVLPEGRSFVADPAVDPIIQMREVYSRQMYVLLFQEEHTADKAMNRDIRGTLRGALRKNWERPRIGTAYRLRQRTWSTMGALCLSRFPAATS